MKKSKTSRNSDLASIHILKKDLGLADDDYRAMLALVTGKSSSADMTPRERVRVIGHMKGLQERARGFRGRPHNIENSPQLRKIEALLTVGRRPWSYADALCKQLSRDCTIQYERVAFAPSWLRKKVIAALVLQGQREGWDLK